MQTMVDDTLRPAQASSRRPGWTRPIAARGPLRVLTATLAAVVFTAGVALCQTPSQPATSGTPIKPKESKASKKISPIGEQPEGSQQPSLTAMTLEEMLAAALKDNPDIRVAEAKLREAESELNRVRLEVAQKVMVFRSQWEVEKAMVQSEEDRVKHDLKLLEQQALSQEEIRAFKLGLQVKRVALTKLEAELPYLLGRAPRDTPDSGASAAVAKTYALNASPSDEFVGELHKILKEVDSEAIVEFFQPNLSLVIRASPQAHTVAASVLLAVKRGGHPVAARSRPRGEMEEKILKALDTPIDANFQDKPLDELLKEFRKSFGIPFVFEPGSAANFRGRNPNPKVTLELGEVPLALVLQAIQDTASVFFNVRDYGIHVSMGGSMGMPAQGGAVDFWKSEKRGVEQPRER